jgi:Zn-dependent peptidase ImmA (M78 family)/DNA-binding XRE family transcriptional regulator
MSNVSSWGNAPLPERLREGRLARGLTQLELSRKIGVTKQAVSQYESGANSLKPEILDLLCEELNLPYNYFFKQIPYNIDSPIFFRKRQSASKRAYEMFETRIKWTVEIFEYLKKFIEFPKPNFISSPKKAYSFEEVHKIAQSVRRNWGLSDGPISNVTLLLENNGFILSQIGLGSTQRVDACSLAITNQPILFYTYDTSAVRSRRDIVHELGHQVLHSEITKEELEKNRKQYEQEAEWFASAFLMPIDSFAREVYSLTSLESLLLLKKRWKVSAQSIIYYLNEIDLLSNNQFTYLKSKIYSRGWRNSEPLDDEIEHEQPSVMHDAMNLIIDNKVKSQSQIVEEISLPREDVEDLCSLERDYLLENQKHILRVVK